MSDSTLSPPELGALVRRLRLQQGLSVADFAHRAGLPTANVETLEAGHSEFDLEELFAIGRGLGMDVSAIFRTWEAHERPTGPSRDELH